MGRVVAGVSTLWHFGRSPTPIGRSNSADSALILNLPVEKINVRFFEIPNGENYNICYNNVRIELSPYLYSVKGITCEKRFRGIAESKPKNPARSQDRNPVRVPQKAAHEEWKIKSAQTAISIGRCSSPR
jgi:hypothetical protein